MTGKFSIIFISFFVVSTFALPQPTQVGSIVDFIKKLVAIIEKIIDRLLADVLSAIDSISNDYEGFHSKVVQVTKDVLLAIIRIFRPSFEKIAEKSTDAGKKLAKCIQDNDESFIDVAVNFFDTTSRCATTEFVAMIKSLKNVVNDLAGVQSDAKEAINKINSCGDDDTSCLLGALIELIEVIVQIPDKIKPDLTPLLNDAKVYVEKIKQCFNDNTDSYYTNAAAALDKLATCAA